MGVRVGAGTLIDLGADHDPNVVPDTDPDEDPNTVLDTDPWPSFGCYALSARIT